MVMYCCRVKPVECDMGMYHTVGQTREKRKREEGSRLFRFSAKSKNKFEKKKSIAHIKRHSWPAETTTAVLVVVTTAPWQRADTPCQCNTRLKPTTR